MTIGIVGAGDIGSTLARKLVFAGHSVHIANSRGPEALKEIAEQTVATAMTVREATQGVEVVILSVPFASIPLLRWLLSGRPGEVVVADSRRRVARGARDRRPSPGVEAARRDHERIFIAWRPAYDCGYRLAESHRGSVNDVAGV